MEFIADKQTLSDLNVMGKYNGASLFSLFNRVSTSGGEQLLEEMFRHPLVDHEAINKRTAMFRYFTDNEIELPFETDDFKLAEQYLLSGGEGTGFPFFLTQALRRWILKQMGLQEEYGVVRNGMNAMISVLRRLLPFLGQLHHDKHHPFYKELQQFLNDATLQHFFQRLSSGYGDGTLWRFSLRDYFFRSRCYKKFVELFNLVYRLDVAITIGAVTREKGFVYAEALPRKRAMFEINDCRHPALRGAIGNDISFCQKENVLFLTGANMAGKSTLMKSIGIAVYLAHMGFPVAASSMKFSVKSGIFSSINVADNLNQGISHFYAEVLRVKEVATSVCAGNDLLVIFDELFKGTNVKDAFDATLEVTRAFARFRACNFLISTHIIEVGEELQAACGNIKYAYMPTVLKGNVPTYTYKMQEGITSDKQGMMIIESEGILEMMK